MSESHILSVLYALLFFCQKLSKLVEIWRSTDKNSVLGRQGVLQFVCISRAGFWWVDSLQDVGLRRLEIAENSAQDSFIAYILTSDADLGRAGRVQCRLTQPVDNDDDDDYDDDGGGFTGGYDDAGNFRLVPVFPAAAAVSSDLQGLI